MNDIIVKSNFTSLCESSTTLIKKEIGHNLLEYIIVLYFRVRTFSFAKDIREKHKVAKKDSRKRSLRTEIKKSSSGGPDV